MTAAVRLGDLLAVLLRRTLPPDGKPAARALTATLALSLAPSIWLWFALGN